MNKKGIIIDIFTNTFLGRVMKHLFPLLLLSTLLFSNDELSFEDDFLQSLDDVSEIATKSKLNIDDAPSFVTVLHSDKLQKLGIDNVLEALAQVPGVQLKREVTGVPVVIFRGVSQKSEVKLMVDGVTINNTYRGSIYHFLDFPIEMVERIEVIRGAGSVLYGSGAISGVINIITKSSNTNETNSVFVSGGTYNYYKGGAIVSSKIGSVKIAVDAYYQEQKKFIENTDRHLEDFSFGLKISDEHFAFLARLKKSIQGNTYGVIGVLDTDTEKKENMNGALFTQLSYNNDLGKDSQIEVLAGFNRYGQIVEAEHPNPAVGLIDARYSENSYYAQVDFSSTLIANNELLIGMRYEDANVEKSEWSTATSQLTPITNPDSKRQTSSVYLNDKYILLESLDISAGLRYDHYSDFGDAVAPTLGLVYRATQEWRVKALYSNAFRAPSWVELTSNTNLKAETSNSFEAGLIYKKDQNSVVRLNVYKTKINDLITKSPTTNKYIQTDYAYFTGTEFEYMFTPNNQLELNFFASYVQAKDQNGEDLADVANTLATLSGVYDLDFGVSIGGLFKYVGSSKRAVNDTRESTPTSIIVDGTLSYSYKDITASLIIKDLFNKGTYYSLPPSSLYNDFYDGGRTALVKASWDF